MVSVSDVIFYVLVFLSVYVQVFFLITFLENRKKIITRKGEIKLTNYPSVTIAVPCWNEENTVEKTVRSLLDLNYPKDKVKIFLIDDGSTDNTWNIIRHFVHYPNIKVFRKANGGKHTALNLGLEHLETDFFGGLDADSFVDSESLVRIMSYFEKDDTVMAIVPSVIVNNPKGFVQNIQKTEYFMGIFVKKMLDFLGAIYVTPGTLTVFNKKVFDDLGPYRHAYNGEDMEIAYRMQKNHYKIAYCNDARVYTNTPETVQKLYRQRLRWFYSFINNTLDYRSILFKRKYGNFAFFTLPTGIVSVFAVGYILGKIVYNVTNFFYSQFIQFQAAGFDLSARINNLDSFFINTKMSLFLIIIVYFIIIFAIMFGRRMSEGKFRFSFSMFYFLPIFSIIAPAWIFMAIFNTVFSRIPVWR